MFGGSPSPRGGARARRRLIGEPIHHVHVDDLGRLMCLSGVLELVGPSCIQELDGVVAVSVVDDTGLRVVCRSAGQVSLRCDDQVLELVGEIAVVVGSREERGMWDERAIRILGHGDQVRVRGILRRRPRPPQGGYRGPAQCFAVEAFGGFMTVDVAAERRPRGMASPELSRLDQWATRLLQPPSQAPDVGAPTHDDGGAPTDDAPTGTNVHGARVIDAYRPHPDNVLRLAALARKRRSH